MVECQGRRFFRGDIAEIGGKAILVLLLALSGCHPIETYRSWVGVSANDPNPETTPNSKNLAAGDARGYPNLATVPPPPTQALTTAQLNKLTQDLIADRANAKYTSEHLQAQFDESAAPPPPPPAPPPRSVAGAPPPAPATAGQPRRRRCGHNTAGRKISRGSARRQPRGSRFGSDGASGNLRQRSTKAGTASRTRANGIDPAIAANRVIAAAAGGPAGAAPAPRIVSAGS